MELELVDDDEVIHPSSASGDCGAPSEPPAAAAARPPVVNPSVPSTLAPGSRPRLSLKGRRAAVGR